MAEADINIDLANWMSHLPDTMWDSPLSEIAIPGSHNSFSSCLDKTSNIGPDAAPAVKMLGPIAKGIVYNWSVTQRLDFTGQLLIGIRYFDLRVAPKGASANIYFVHGLYGSTVEEGLEHVLAFMKSHEKEIVILDFNHFYDMSENEHRKFLNMIIEKCGEKICLFVGMDNLTLRMMWENGLQLVIIYQHPIAEDFVQVWPGSRNIIAPWSKTANPADLLCYIDANLTKSRDKKFHVSQCILSPDTGFILSHMNRTLEDEVSKKLMPDIIKWLQEKSRGNCGLNIVMADFVDLNNFTNAVIWHNFKQ